MRPVNVAQIRDDVIVNVCVCDADVWDFTTWDGLGEGFDELVVLGPPEDDQPGPGWVRQADGTFSPDG